jgi:SAM-dependent methyltransferase
MITCWPAPVERLLRHVRWRGGLRDECEFWRRWLEERGGKWPADFAYRMDPDAQLAPHLVERLPRTLADPIEILDVGAGPMTIVGKRVGDRRACVTAIDPLAPAYDRLLDSMGLMPPVRTQHGEGERLVQRFGSNRFDMVISVNAVDHARDPLLVIRQMLCVAKPGANVVLEHTANEGERNAYAGLHQWNFTVNDGRLMLWRTGTRIDISTAVSHVAETDCGERVSRIFVTMRKHRV